jgi:hypothetical protein
LNVNFSYASEMTDAVSSSAYEPQPDDWYVYHSLSGGVNISYVIVGDLTFTLNTSNVHTYYIRDRVRRYKEVPAESFFDLGAGLSYSF